MTQRLIVFLTGDCYCAIVPIKVRKVKIHPWPPNKEASCYSKSWSWSHRKGLLSDFNFLTLFWFSNVHALPWRWLRTDEMNSLKILVKDLQIGVNIQDRVRGQHLNFDPVMFPEPSLLPVSDQLQLKRDCRWQKQHEMW